jgi:hypothetical protein
LKPDLYKKLAASGRYVNTGKVLIGLQYQRPPRQMGREEERIQAIMLGLRPARDEYPATVYLLYLIGLSLLIAAIAEMLK